MISKDSKLGMILKDINLGMNLGMFAFKGLEFATFKTIINSKKILS